MRSSIFVCIALSLLLACGEQVPSFRTVADYKAEALASVVTYAVTDTLDFVGNDSVVFVDVREADEIVRNGKIPGSVHVPRGVLEFYIDPSSSLHKDVFSSGKKIFFYCATGGRSVLATKVATDMGLPDAVHLNGGFRAWTDAGGPIDPPPAVE